MKWRVNFFVTADNKNFTSSMEVTAPDRSSAVAIVEAIYGGKISIRWVDQL